MPLGGVAVLRDGGGMGNVIALVPATGGTGSTTLAAAVAVRAAAAGRSSVIVDLDRLAGRLDVVLGIEEEDGWRWPDLAGVSGVVDGSQLLRELPMARGAAALSFGPADLGGDTGAALAPGAPAPEWGREPSGAAYRLDDASEWLERACDVVAGLREAADVVVLDCPRDERVLEALADEIDVVVITVGTAVAQVASAAVAVPLVRLALDRVRLAPSPATSLPLVPPVEPWVVLRGGRVDEQLHDLLMDHLDVPVIGTVGDDRHVLADLAAGVPPGTRGRGSVVEMADRLLLRLVTQLEAA
jgi:septum formation inhibitor-activating ATPase MinD